jgi:hypothetical protein
MQCTTRQQSILFPNGIQAILGAGSFGPERQYTTQSQINNLFFDKSNNSKIAGYRQVSEMAP